MGDARSNLFGESDDALDLTSFQPKKPARQDKAIAKQSAEQSGFKSREPKREPAALRVQQRRYRTGRNAQFNVKAKPETISDFCAVADANGWVLGEALEKAVDLLKKEYGTPRR